MAEQTKIEWATNTFNPWRGCQKRPNNRACDNCYAEAFSQRNPGTLGVWGSEERGATRVVASEDMWSQPKKWNCEAEESAMNAAELQDYGATHERPRVFCASLCDVFENWQGPMLDHRGHRMMIDSRWPEPEDWACGNDRYLRPLTMDDVRRRLFRLIDATPNLDWLLLTKRPENVRRMWPGTPGISPKHQGTLQEAAECLFRDNVWIGTSAADQDSADAYIPKLLECRDLASKLFVSLEPLVGPVDLTQTCINPPQEVYGAGGPYHYAGDAGIDYCIIGGESGPKARPCNVQWIRDIVQQCRAAGVKCFVKQLGANVVDVNPLTDWPGVPHATDLDWPAARVHLQDKKGTYILHSPR